MAGRWGSTPGHVPAGQLGELGQRADAPEVALVAPPDRERGAPEPVAGQGPVDVVGQPLPHPTVTDVLGVPPDGLVLGHQFGLPVRGPHVPAGLAPVDEGGAAPPAVGVGVGVGVPPEQEPGRLQPVVDLGVGVPHALAGQPGHRGGEAPVGTDRVEGGEAVVAPDLAVDLAEGRGQVDDAGALVGLHELAGHHPPAVAPASAGPGTPGRRTAGRSAVRPVRDPDSRWSTAAPSPNTSATRSAATTVVPDHGVAELGADGGTGVGQQGPRRRGPGHEGQAGSVPVRAPSAGGRRPPPRRSAGSARRPTRPPRHGRRRAVRARGWTGRCRTGGSRAPP